LLDQGDDHNFIILHADEAKNYFVQFAGSRGEAIVRGEAVSNLYLEPVHMLDPKRSKALRALGWNPPTPGQSPNFYRDWDARDARTRRQMARLALRTLVEIYGLEPTAHVWCKLSLCGASCLWTIRPRRRASQTMFTKGLEQQFPCADD